MSTEIRSACNEHVSIREICAVGDDLKKHSAREPSPHHHFIIIGGHAFVGIKQWALAL